MIHLAIMKFPSFESGVKKMKELTDAERLDIALALLSDRDVEEYEKLCELRALEPERNGFYDIPVECEDLECADCAFDSNERKRRECPYLDD